MIVLLATLLAFTWHTVTFFLLHIPPSSSRQAVWNVARSSVPLCRAETQWLNLCSAVPNAPVGKTLLTNTLFHWAMLSWCDPHPPPSIIIPPTPQSHPLQVISPGSLQAWGLRPKPAGTTGQFTSPGRPSTSTTSSPPSKATSVWCARAPWVTLHLTFFILFYFIQFFLDCIIKENCTYIWIVILRRWGFWWKKLRFPLQAHVVTPGLSFSFKRELYAQQAMGKLKKIREKKIWFEKLLIIIRFHPFSRLSWKQWAGLHTARVVRPRSEINLNLYVLYIHTL